MAITFKSLRVFETDSNIFSRVVVERNTDELPPHEVLVQVKYAGLNYKDALSATGNRGITRHYPHTPGIDASGVVVQSSHSDFRTGDEVIVTSYDLGMNTDGGFGEYIRVPAAWVVRLPKGLTLEEAMILGTAGYTAGLAVYKMLRCGQTPEMGAIVVTGATGGVGSMAVSIFSKIGYDVVAVTGKPDAAADYLRQIGAKEIWNRTEVDDASGRPLLRPKWAGAVDTVGGNTLATLLKACKRNGSVAVTGLVASATLGTTVYPFILNGVNLLGIDSAETPMNTRVQIWQHLASEWKPNQLELIHRPVTLENLNSRIDQMLEGKHYGRTVVHF